MPDFSSRIKVSAGQIFWRETADNHRPVVIFLHGSWDDSRQWQDIMELLSNNFHCLAIDLLGFGNSTAMETPGSIAVEVDCLHEFINALKLRPVYLIGHSLGAWVAVSYTLKYPDRVRGVVAISPEGFSLANWQQYSKFTRWLLAHPWFFKLWLSGLALATSMSDGADPLVNRQKYWNFFSDFPTTCKILFQRSSKDLQCELVADKLRQFGSPFLVLQSDADSRYTIEQSQAYARSVRKSEYKSIGDFPPFASEETLLEIAQEIKFFCNRVQLQIEREEVELW
jgi:pimeloyl-ACP methyl ester carboxylesterase